MHKKRSPVVDMSAHDAFAKKLSQGGGNVTEEDIKYLTKINKKLSDQILGIAKKTYSDATDVNINPDDKKRCYNVYDVRGTTIAFLWINNDRTITMIPNEEVYPLRVN